MERTHIPTCMLKVVLHSQRVANPEELVWSQREGGKRKRRLRTKLQPPSLVGHLEPSVVRNVFSLEKLFESTIRDFHQCELPIDRLVVQFLDGEVAVLLNHALGHLKESEIWDQTESHIGNLTYLLILHPTSPQDSLQS